MEWLNGHLVQALIGTGIIGIGIKAGVDWLIGFKRKKLPRSAVVMWSYRKWSKLRAYAIDYNIPIVGDVSEKKLEELVIMTKVDESIGCIAAMFNLDPRELAKRIETLRDTCKWESTQEELEYLEEK